MTRTREVPSEVIKWVLARLCTDVANRDHFLLLSPDFHQQLISEPTKCQEFASRYWMSGR